MVPAEDLRDPDGTRHAGPMTNFSVRLHEVRVWSAAGRWHVAVDGVELSTWYVTQADAWSAGVREADRLDVVAA
jgi:hypothetical protein